MLTNNVRKCQLGGTGLLRISKCKKLIILSLVFALAVPVNTVFAGDYSPVYGGAAKIAIEEKAAPKVVHDNDTRIADGVYVDEINLSGLTYDQAVKKIKEYVSTLGEGKIDLETDDGEKVTVTAKDLGISWNDTDVIDEALTLGRTGNLVSQYKEQKDLLNENKVYELNLIYDYEAIRRIVEDKAQSYDVEPVNGKITKEGDSFSITPGIIGREIDVDGSAREIQLQMKNYKGEDKTIALKEVENSTEGAGDLSKVKDILGSYTTSFKSSNADRSGNVKNGTSLVNGTLLLPGEQFSMYKTVSPFTKENGYFMAGSYLNGMVVESLGGGICQVSSTLYNAVIRAELQVDERFNHSMIVSYVQLSSDAAISGTTKDFKFTNSTDNPIYIEGYTTEDKQVVFNIYGVETRPKNRTIEFESVQLSKTEPVEEKIVADPGKPLGYVSTQSAHIGYTGELYKIVKVDGEQTERILLNKSTYHPSPKTATVGTATSNPAALAALQSAMATGSIDYVRSTISSLNAAAAAAVAAPVPGDI